MDCMKPSHAVWHRHLGALCEHMQGGGREPLGVGRYTYTQTYTDQVFSLLTIQASDNYMYPIKHIHKLFSQYLYFLVDRV